MPDIAPPEDMQSESYLKDISALFPNEAPVTPPEPLKPPDVSETPKTPPAAPEPPAVKPAGPVVNPDDEVPADIKSPASQSSWKRLRDAKKAVEMERDSIRKEREQTVSELNTLRTDFETLKKEATTQKVKVEDMPEYKALRDERERLGKELETYSDRLRLADVEKHPKFQQYFDAKLNQVMAMAQTVGGEKAVTILKMPESPYRDEQLEMLVNELGVVKGGRLVTVDAGLQMIHAERDAEIAKARENYKAIHAKEQLAIKERKEQLDRIFSQTRETLGSKDKGIAVFQHREGDEQWNQDVTAREALARRMFSGEMSPEELARTAFWGAAAPAFLVELNGTRAKLAAAETEAAAKVAALEAEIAKLRGGAPKPGGDDVPAGQQEQGEGLSGLMAGAAKFYRQ